MCEENLFHDVVILDHLEQFDNVKITVELVPPFIQLKVLLCRLVTLELISTTAVSAAEEVHDSKACAVGKPPLIQDQMENVVQLVSFGLMTDEFASLFLHPFHKVLLVSFFVAVDTLEKSIRSSAYHHGSEVIYLSCVCQGSPRIVFTR